MHRTFSRMLFVCNDSFSCGTIFFMFWKASVVCLTFLLSLETLGRNVKCGHAEKINVSLWQKQKVAYVTLVCVCNMCKCLELWERRCWVYEQRRPAQRPVSIPVPAGFTAHFKSFVSCQHISFQALMAFDRFTKRRITVQQDKHQLHILR